MESTRRNEGEECSLLAQRYHLIREIGRGGMGVVYEGLDVTLGRKVAVKLANGSALSPRKIARFHREARLTARLNHPGIVKLLDFGVDESNQPFLVLEFLEGESLKTLIDRRGEIELRALLSIFVSIAEAMAEAHKEGVIHRDLSPGNILVTDPEKALIKIIDFGIGKAVEQWDYPSGVTSRNSIIGNPTYLSPEQITGEEIDSRTDIYTFGCSLFEAVTGKQMYFGDTNYEILQKHLKEPTPDLDIETCDRRTNISLDSLIKRCTAKKIQDRYQCMSEIIADLNAIQEQISAPSKSLPDFGDAPASKREGGSKSILLPVLAFCLLGGITFSFYPEKKVERPEAATRSELVNRFFELDSTPAQPDPAPAQPAEQYRIELTPAELCSWKGAGNKEIEIKNHAFVPGELETLSPGAPLETIRLENCTIDSTCLESLSRTALTRLTLKNCHLDRQAMYSLGKLRGLRSLKMCGTRCDRPDLIPVGSLRRLMTLELQDNLWLEDRHIRELPRLTNLRRLSLSSTSITDKTLAMIGKMPGLQVVILRNTRVGDKGVGFLEGSNIMNLSLEGTKITSRSLYALARIPALRKLFISDCPNITPVAIHHFWAKNQRCAIVL